LNVLKELTGSLVNIHSQYNTLELKSRTYQLEIVDTLGDLKGEAESFAKNYKSLSTLSSELKRLNEQLSTALQQQDYNAFQLKELEELNLERTDFNSLEGELLKSENSEGILSALQAIEAVVEGENQVLDRLRIVKASLDKIKGVDKDVDELASRIQSSMIELADIAADAQRFSGQIEIDPAKLVELTSVLNRYNHALKKHNLLDQAALLEFKNQLESSVVGTTDLQSEIERLTQNFSKEKVAVETAAKKLHAARLKAIEPISKSIQAILVELKLPNTKLDFKLTERDELNSNGCTDIVLNFSANLGIETVPIEKAASGGELARVMLALQKLISEKRLLPTVLFDEIDTGVSGDVAQKIGALLQKMGDHFQLFAISHLPQVAAKAAHHFRVEKEIINNRTTTRVAVLNEQERIEEIARLMSGELITDAAIENAKALMN
jgi:DNA repair protein RecN (Recombination protein N)